MNTPIDEWNLFLIHHLCEKLDSGSLTQIIKNTPQNTILKFSEFVNILKKRVQILESCKQTTISCNQSPSNSDNRFKQGYASKPFRSFVSNEINCLYCNEKHTLEKCPKFIDPKLTPEKRFEFVKAHQLCTNCLSDKHRVFECKSGSCALCALKHNILLHFGRNHNSNIKNQQTTSQIPNNNIKDTTVAHSSIDNSHLTSLNTDISIDCEKIKTHSANQNIHSEGRGQVLLATAVIWVSTSNGNRVKCRALLDSGSQSNFITERICQILKPRKKNVSIPVTGINQNKVNIRYIVDLNIKSLLSDFSRNLQFLILPKITGYLPSEPINFNVNEIPNFIELADPNFFNPDKIDLLIGAEIYHEIITNERLEIIKDFHPFISTVFGYIVSGKIDEKSSNTDKVDLSSKQVYVHTCTFEDLNSKVEKFWQLEEVAIKNTFSIEEKQCEEHYKQNVVRDSFGRYSVALPVKSNISQLGESSHNAFKQFKYLEQKLIKNPKLYNDYAKFMTEYINLNHMTEVKNVSQNDNQHNKVYYLPHHCVIKENSSTTKLRVVFNASSKTSTNLSLNECLMTGPTIQQDLFCIVLRFRKYPIAFTGDIAKMYRQIRLRDNQQDLHRIWWRDTPSSDIKCYRLCTVTYGTASAPFLAIRTLSQLAADEALNYPAACIVLNRDFYVDDVLSGGFTVEETIKLKSDLVNVLQSGGFELRKFASNHTQLASNEEDYNDMTSVLGMQWNTVNDTFNISLAKYKSDNKSTKRKVLSEIAQLFDPLGLCAPMIFVAKLFMQSLWTTLGLNWDDEIPREMNELWNSFKEQLSEVEKISVPRCLIPNSYKHIELHAFGDASEKGFGCAIYIRVIDEFDNIYVRLLCAKSRIAPLKTQTIPRLELCAALLVAQLAHKVVGILDSQFNSIVLWSDSEITLLRIKSLPSRFATFVANRVSQIQELSIVSNWRYVPTEINPADLVSRGLMPKEICNSSLWWNGPSFLYTVNDQWPISPNSHISSEALELRKIANVVLNTTKDDWNLFNKFSSFKKLLRVTATCIRFINNCKTNFENRKFGALQSFEIDSAMKVLVKHIQSYEYAEDIKQLIKHNLVSVTSKIKSLSPFLDENQILRVGGRLIHANIPYDSQHQILLPAAHPFTKLLILDRHLTLYHAGPQTLLYNVRLRFWIIGGRNLCRKIVKECIRCVRSKPKMINQIMGQLPTDRVNASIPFNTTGIDFCGPFYVIQNIRSKIKNKVYIAIFVCFAVKAVHMEIVGDLSTQSFLAALRRFIARRGKCSRIYSDNATNFIGARSELKELHNLFMSEINQNEIFKFCVNQGIEWHTIPARSPHFGGLWEAAVKSAKFHLKRVVGLSTYTIEEFHTLVTQVEACLNSRPLSPMSEDPSDMSPLTPGHFLIGQPINALSEPSLDHLKFNRLSRYQQIQALLQQFWSRWSREYLSGLQYRRKWTTPTNDIKIGSLVIIHEDGIPPMKWNMGRITAIHYGNDGLARVVTIKTASSEFKRAITKISILPVQSN